MELHTPSAFSFLQGARLPKTLSDRGAALGYPAIALLDRDGVYAAPRFHKAALAAGIRPIIGAELTIGNLEVKSEKVKVQNPSCHFSLFTSHFTLPVLCE